MCHLEMMYLPRHDVLSLNDWSDLVATGRRPISISTPLSGQPKYRCTLKWKDRSYELTFGKISAEKDAKSQHAYISPGAVGSYLGAGGQLFHDEIQRRPILYPSMTGWWQ